MSMWCELTLTYIMITIIYHDGLINSVALDVPIPLETAELNLRYKIKQALTTKSYKVFVRRREG